MKSFNQWNIKNIIEFSRHVDKKTWVKISIIVLGALLFLIFVVVPAWIERPLIRRKIESLQAQIRQANALNQKRLIWEEHQSQFGEVITKTQARLFAMEEIELLLGQVSRMAADSRVDMLSSKPLPAKIIYPEPYHSRYQANSYAFSVYGEYHDFGRFAGCVESNDRLLRIQSIHIIPSDKWPGKQIAEWQISAISASPQQTATVSTPNAKK